MARDNIKSLSPLLLKKMPEFGKLINIPFQYKSESCDRSRKCYVNGDGKVFFSKLVVLWFCQYYLVHVTFKKKVNIYKFGNQNGPCVIISKKYVRLQLLLLLFLGKGGVVRNKDTFNYL